MDVTEERIVALERGLDAISKKLDRIDQGIFGDPKLGFPGIVENQRAQDIYIKTLESRIDALEQKMQDNALRDSAEKQFVDKLEMWGKRTFWIVSALLAIFYFLTGHIGLLEMLKIL